MTVDQTAPPHAGMPTGNAAQALDEMCSIVRRGVKIALRRDRRSGLKPGLLESSAVAACPIKARAASSARAGPSPRPKMARRASLIRPSAHDIAAAANDREISLPAADFLKRETFVRRLAAIRISMSSSSGGVPFRGPTIKSRAERGAVPTRAR